MTLCDVYYSDQSCWIGLYKAVPEASDSCSYWLDGNPSTYRNWRRKAPDSENVCVHMNKNGRYRDRNCSETRRYVCKGIYFFVLKLFFRLFSVWFRQMHGYPSVLSER